MTAHFEGFIPIDDHGLLLVQGPDAKSFLQGQVTCDIQALEAGNNGLSTLGAHCTPKGRMLFTFRAFAMAEDLIALSIVKPLIADAKKALEKYSVFSKVEIIDASEDYRILGFTDQHNESITTLPTELNSTVSDHQGTVIAIDKNRYEYYLAKHDAEALLVEFPSTADINQWHYQQILAGLGEVTPETTDELLPQMLNLQIIGTGISFDKGCYTGQEVVARTHYLGKLKRRLYRFSCPAEYLVHAGMPLYTEGSNQSIGQIILASPYQVTPEDNIQLLAVVTEKAAEQATVCVDLDGQQKLQLQSLPYAIPKE